MWNPFKKAKAKSLREQLDVLASCGIRPRRDVTLADLLISASEKKYAEGGFAFLVMRMGGEVEEEPFRRVSDNLWHLDTECIEAHGDYVRVAEAMRDLAAGDLPLQEITDHVDIDAGVARLQFRLDGKLITWDARVDGDWIDPSIASRFAELLAARGTGRRFTYFDPGDQTCLLGCMTAEQLKALKKQTGLAFEWLE